MEKTPRLQGLVPLSPVNLRSVHPFISRSALWKDMRHFHICGVVHQEVVEDLHQTLLEAVPHISEAYKNTLDHVNGHLWQFNVWS